MDMQDRHGQETTAQDPQHGFLRENWVQQLFQEVRVVVEVGLPHVHLEVADHMEQHEAQKTNAGDGHHILFAHGCAVEVNQKRSPTASRPFNCGAGDRTPLHRCLRHDDLRLSELRRSIR